MAFRTCLEATAVLNATWTMANDLNQPSKQWPIRLCSHFGASKFTPRAILKTKDLSLTSPSTSKPLICSEKQVKRPFNSLKDAS